MGFERVYLINQTLSPNFYIMKVYISNYRYHWISPYTILEKVFFWREIDYDEPIIDKWANRLEPISKAIQKVLDTVRPRVVDVKIDYWDTWSMDSTLAPIILPMLKQLRDTKHGSPMVDMEDVPEYMRTTTTEDWDSQRAFDFYNEDVPDGYDVHKRWEWVLNEMIFAFEHLIDDSWEEAYSSGEFDTIQVPCEWDENGKPTLYSMEHGPNHTYYCDYAGINKVYERIDNGLRLFGKYFRHLWD
jgi:hypothetical protein